MPPTRKTNQMKTDDTNTKSAAGADSLDRIVRKSHAASRSSGLRAIADGLDAPESTISIWQVQECLRVAADKIELLESKQSAINDMLPIVQAVAGKGPLADDRWNLKAFAQDALAIHSANASDHRCSPGASTTTNGGNE
jgi:hypothetical protein